MPDFFDSGPLDDVEESFGDYQKDHKIRGNIKVIADTVYARLRDAILSAELRPNRHLVEDELAEWLNVSRTPIREALICLEKDGLVERKRGWLVREHSPAEIQARLECRLVLEGYATRLAAAHRSEAILQELYSFAVRLEKPDITGLEYNQVNDHFHQIIIKAAMNPTLETLHSQTQMNYWGLRMPVTFGPEVDQKIHEQHLALIEAIAARDGDRAETIARNHVQLNMKIILESLGMKLNGSLLSFP